MNELVNFVTSLHMFTISSVTPTKQWLRIHEVQRNGSWEENFFFFHLLTQFRLDFPSVVFWFLVIVSSLFGQVFFESPKFYLYLLIRMLPSWNIQNTDWYMFPRLLFLFFAMGPIFKSSYIVWQNGITLTFNFKQKRYLHS